MISTRDSSRALDCRRAFAFDRSSRYDL